MKRTLYSLALLGILSLMLVAPVAQAQQVRWDDFARCDTTACTAAGESCATFEGRGKYCMTSEEETTARQVVEGKSDDATKTPGSNTGTSQQSSSGSGTNTGESGFQPLTQIPGIKDVADSSTLPNFLNTLYKLCVGIAAALAVLQIMRGGMTYMLGDSVTEKKEARNLIAMSVVGLLLVLSPAIVFGIIDPRILNLQVDFTKLQSTPGSSHGSPGEDEGQSGEDAGSHEGGVEEPEEEPVGGTPATGCDPGFEPTYSAQGETCEPVSETSTVPVSVTPNSYVYAQYVYLNQADAQCYYFEVDDQYQTQSACKTAHGGNPVVGQHVGPYTITRACELAIPTQAGSNSAAMGIRVPNPVCPR